MAFHCLCIIFKLGQATISSLWIQFCPCKDILFQWCGHNDFIHNWGFVHTYWRSKIIGLCGWPSNKSSHRLSIKVHPLQFDIPTLWPFQSPSLSPNNSDQGEIWKSWIPLPTHGLVIFQGLLKISWKMTSSSFVAMSFTKISTRNWKQCWAY